MTLKSYKDMTKEEKDKLIKNFANAFADSVLSLDNELENNKFNYLKDSSTSREIKEELKGGD